LELNLESYYNACGLIKPFEIATIVVSVGALICIIINIANRIIEHKTKCKEGSTQ